MKTAHPRQFTITRLRVTGPDSLSLRFADGAEFELDLSRTIARYPALAALADAKLFATAKADARGGYVVWAADDLEMASDNLRALAVDQAGAISHEWLLNWMDRHSMTLDAGAEALGLSRRMVAYYRSGAKPVPRTVWLACLGWEAQQRKAA